jgi:AraC family transcriptional regulator
MDKAELKAGARPYHGLPSRWRRAGAFELEQWIADRPGDRMQPHGHAEAHVMYVMGDGYITCARGEPARNRTHLIYNPPGTYHRDRLTRPGRFFTLTLSKHQTALLNDLALPAVPSQSDAALAHRLVGKLVRACADWEPDSALDAETLAFELLGAIAAPRSKERAAPRWLTRVLDMLEADTGGGLTLAALSRAANVHPVHLTRTFRAFHGCTPGEYLRGKRLERAATLLAATRAPLVDIAIRCGFADQSHFNRQFQRAIGVTPAAYRRLTTR